MCLIPSIASQQNFKVGSASIRLRRSGWNNKLASWVSRLSKESEQRMKWIGLLQDYLIRSNSLRSR